jgi:hypothetical protein
VKARQRNTPIGVILFFVDILKSVVWIVALYCGRIFAGGWRI